MNIAEKVDNVFLFILVISVVLLVFITFLMIFFVIKYNKNKNKESKNIHGNAILEVVWTIVPTILVLAMFYYGWVSYSYVKNIPEDAIPITVTGRMWSWAFTYENGIQADTLFVPLGEKIKLDLTSQDVIHSFFVPRFRIKQDVVPGMTNNLWFETSEEGTYDILCAEYCGLQHSYMLSSLVVMPKNEFDEWYSANAPSGTMKSPKTETVEISLAQKGKQQIATLGCTACHTTDGSASVGPTLKGLYGEKQIILVNGNEKRITVDEHYLRQSIINPQAEVTKGYENVMPQQDLSQDQINQIIAFIKQLSNAKD